MSLQGYPTRAHKAGSKILTASIVLGASGAVNSTDLVTSGIAVSAVRTSAGLYTIVLSDPYSALEFASAALAVPSAADIHAQVVSYTVATKTLIVRTIAVATETDAASGVTIQLLLVMKEM